jgi:CubicO group peptidase (beta-lactamase class C family)
MNLKFHQLSIYLFFSVIIGYGQTIHSDSLDILIEDLMEKLNVPGLSIAIVSNDSTLYAKGYGTKNITKNDPVDSNTLFGIGSISKSFTALALGILISDGKINWDDRVIDYLPYFELYDPYVTNTFTIRDLLTHRSGLKEISAGTLLIHSTLSRTEIIKRLKYLKPVSAFRYTAAYQNVMYIVAGEIVAVVSGMSWENFVEKRILSPIGMNNTVTNYIGRQQSTNIALPHVFNEQFENIVIEQEKNDNAAPAGWIFSSANDMALYMKFLLNDGIVLNDTIIKKEVLDEIFTPQIHYPFWVPPHTEFTSYGFGWWLTPRQGHKVIEHSGGIDGMRANLIMISDLNFGIIIMGNPSHSLAFILSHNIVGNKINDEFLVEYANTDTLINEFDKRKERIVKERQRIIDSRIRNTKPSLRKKEYAGTFNDVMYGDVYVTYGSRKLKIEFSHTPIFTGQLSHWHYDTFKLNWNDPRFPDGFVTFILDSKGEISELKLDIPNFLDVDFSELTLKNSNLTNSPQ